ncbi:MAG TPA: hypothetical protein DDW85_02410 [Porphyromonadaceae bacterium]|nr:hypothetical protein [Porphyromonadaceae bacterium]
MKQEFKVIHVELAAPYKGRKHYYFGSKAAIYHYLPEDVIGIGLKTLWNKDLKESEYTNDECTIRTGILKRKPMSE